MVIRMNNAQKENSVMSSDQQSYIMLPNGTLLPITDCNEKSVVTQSYKSDHSQLVNDQSNIVHCTPTYTSQQTVLQPVIQQPQIIQAMPVCELQNQPNSNLVTFSFQSQPNYILQPAIISQTSQPTLISQSSIICQPSISCQPTTAVISQTGISQQVPSNNSLVNTDLLSQSIQNILIDSINHTPQGPPISQGSPHESSDMNEKMSSGSLLSQAWSLSCGDSHPQTPSETKPTIQQVIMTGVPEKNNVLEQALDTTFSPPSTVEILGSVEPVIKVNDKTVNDFIKKAAVAESNASVEELNSIGGTQPTVDVKKEPENRPKYGKMTHSDIADLCSIVETKIKPKRPSIFEEMSQRMAKMLNCEVKDISVPRDKYKSKNLPKAKTGESKQKNGKTAQQSTEPDLKPRESTGKASECKLTESDLNEPSTKLNKTSNKSIETAPKVIVSETKEIPVKLGGSNITDTASTPSQISDEVSSGMCDDDSMDLPELYIEDKETSSLNSEQSPSGRPSRKRKLPKKLCDVTGEDKGPPATSLSSPYPKMCLRDAKKPRFEPTKDQQMKDNSKPKVQCRNTKRTSLRLKQNSDSSGISKGSDHKQDKRQAAMRGKEGSASQSSGEIYTVDLSDLAVSLNARGEVVLKMPQMMRGTGSVNINFDIEHLDDDDCLRFRIENQDNILSSVFSEEAKKKEETSDVPTNLPSNKRMRRSTRSSSDSASTSTDSDKKPPAIMKILSNNPETKVQQNILNKVPHKVVDEIAQGTVQKVPQKVAPGTMQEVTHQLVQKVVKQELNREVRDCSTQVCLSKESSVEEADTKSVVLEAKGFTSYPRFSNITATSTAVVHRVLKPVRKGLSLDPTDKALTWFCGLCHQPGDFGDLGPLFGPFDLMVPHEKSGKKDLGNTAGLSEGVKNLFEKLHSALSTMRHTAETLDTHEKTNLVREVIWLHEDCVCWSPGVYMLGFDVFGLEEVFRVARVTVCSHCSKLGASLGCFSEGCTLRYHYLCALHARCTLITDTFTVLCTTHSRVKMDGSKAMQHKPLVRVRKHLLKEHLEMEFPETATTNVTRVTEKKVPHNKHHVSLRISKRTKIDSKSKKQCHVCRKNILKVLMNKHVQSHREQGDKRVRSHHKKKNNTNNGSIPADIPNCVECGLEFKHHTTYIAHMSSKHEDFTPYKCKACCKCYQHFTSLKKHRQLLCPNRPDKR